MRKSPTIYDVFTDASVSQHKNEAGLGWVIFKQPKGGRFIKAGAKKITGKHAKKNQSLRNYGRVRSFAKNRQKIGNPLA